MGLLVTCAELTNLSRNLVRLRGLRTNFILNLLRVGVMLMWVVSVSELSSGSEMDGFLYRT